MTIHDLIDAMAYVVAFFAGVVLTVVYFMVTHKNYAYGVIPRDTEGNPEWPKPGVPAMRYPPPPPPSRTIKESHAPTKPPPINYRPLPGSLAYAQIQLDAMHVTLRLLNMRYGRLTAQERVNKLNGEELLTSIKRLAQELKSVEETFNGDFRSGLNGNYLSKLDQ